MSKKGVNEDFLANMTAKQARNWTPATEAEIADNEALKARLRGDRQQATPSVSPEWLRERSRRRAYNEFGGAKAALASLLDVPLSDPSGAPSPSSVSHLREAIHDLTDALTKWEAAHLKCDCGPDEACSRCAEPGLSVQEWGAGPGQRPVPYESDRACAESKAVRDAYDRASAQAARAGHPDPHGAALVVLLDAKAEARGST